MIRLFSTGYWSDSVKILYHHTGQMVETYCKSCSRFVTLPLEEIWCDYRKIIFMCTRCKGSLGSAEIRRKH